MRSDVYPIPGTPLAHTPLAYSHRTQATPVFVQTGNSPTMISKAMLLEMLPRWDRTVRAIHADLSADKALGWAQEMFAFSLALANHPSGPPDISYHQEFMAQPPFDRSLTLDLCQVCPLPSSLPLAPLPRNVKVFGFATWNRIT